MDSTDPEGRPVQSTPRLLSEESLPAGTMLVPPTLKAGFLHGTSHLGPPPENLGRFEVRGELGRGGMGRVLDAFDPVLGRAVVGTPGYISPEQASGDGACPDSRADVWSLGAMLYELITFRRAFPGSGPPIAASPTRSRRSACGRSNRIRMSASRRSRSWPRRSTRSWTAAVDVSVPDASLCAMRLSRAGRPQPYRVGEYDGDVSIYGVRDLAGGTRDWCGGDGYGADPPRRPVRGGSWDSHAVYCRISHRTAYIPTYIGVSFGFRLVKTIP
jgi:hypothetical protein